MDRVDPNAEASGAAMIAVLNCARGEHLRPIMDKHGLRNVDPAEWYPMRVWLDVIKDIAQDSMAPYDLIAIGKEIAINAPLSEVIETVEDAVIELPQLYQRNYRKGNVGHYLIEKVKDGHLKVIGHVPFPGDLTLGVLRGLVKRYASKSLHYSVTLDLADGVNTASDADHFTFDVKWWN
ncbi:MAG: hypothetical protein RLP44_29030 [Aggregatilineales bacterium]